VECLPADKPWDVVSVTRRSSGVAPRACVRVYARVLVPPNLYSYIQRVGSQRAKRICLLMVSSWRCPLIRYQQRSHRLLVTPPFCFVLLLNSSYIQLRPQKLSAWRMAKKSPRRPRRRRVARRPSAASREKNPAAAGIRRFFSLEQRVEKKDIGPRRSRSRHCRQS